LGGGSERHYQVGGRKVIETEFGSLKVPRQCPLVLLVEVKLVFGICSVLIFKDVGTAVNNFPTFYGIRKFLYLFTRALHWFLS
jgi:hypothetical protein